MKICAIVVFTVAFYATASSERPVAPAFDALYKCTDSNYTPRQPGSSSPGRDVMICIMPDKFAQVFQTYAAWKHKSGTFIKIVKFSEIGASNTEASCSTAIKPYIKNAYQTWKYRPTYILLIGDAGVFPLKKYSSPTEGSYMANNTTDEYFGEVDNANRYEPDIMVGRLCVKDTSETGILLKKMMQYERTPSTTNTAWFKRTVAISSNQTWAGKSTFQVETVREVSKMQIALGYTVDTLMCDADFTGGLDSVIQSINKGCSFINYRGQGWAEGWTTPCYQFYVPDVPLVQNAGMLPFITGIGCGITMFDYNGSVTECFGEEMMRLGTPSAPRGAIAVLGPGGETHSYWNNEMDKGLYHGMFEHGLQTPGQALITAIDAMYKSNLNKDTSDYLARLYLVLGDPSIHIWKNVPQTATITNPATIPVGTSNQTITVKIGSQPVRNAQVCISGALTDSVAYASGFTDTNGSATLSITTTANGTLSLVARGGNILPVEKQINVIAVGTIQNLANGPAFFSLRATYPNPFVSTTTIAYSLPKAGYTTLSIYSPRGALVRTLTYGIQSAGFHSIAWNGRNDKGITVAQGTYFISLRQANSVVRQRIIKY